jgi:DNA-binding MarR family transcriptional regulator
MLPMSHQDLDANFSFLLYDAARLLRRNFDRRARAIGLTRARWSVLAHLARHEGVTQTEMAEILDIQPITLVRLLDHLEAAGLVERRPDPADRRVWTLYLTPEAHPLLDSIRALAAETREEALEGVSPELRHHLIEGLWTVRANLSDKEQASRRAESPRKRSHGQS